MFFSKDCCKVSLISILVKGFEEFSVPFEELPSEEIFSEELPSEEIFLEELPLEEILLEELLSEDTPSEELSSNVESST